MQRLVVLAAGLIGGLAFSGLAQEATPPVPPVGLPVQVNPPLAPTPFLLGVTWIRRPTAQLFDHYYPAEANQKNIGGRVALDCLVSSEADGMEGHAISCTIASETPEDFGFGAAALHLSEAFRAATTTVDGRPTAGGRVRVNISFNSAGG